MLAKWTHGEPCNAPREPERRGHRASLGNNLVAYREVTFPVRLGSWTGIRWEIVNPDEWLTGFGGPPSFLGENGRQVEPS